MFDSDKIGKFDAFVFETTGNLLVPGTDKQPPMTEQGLDNFLKAIEAGKGFVGFHCATDTFGDHRKMGAADPYTKMIGGHFAGHGAQQVATIDIADHDFPGSKAFGSGDSFQLNDEWYAQKYLADDLHVIYYYDTKSMKGHDYERPELPPDLGPDAGQGPRLLQLDGTPRRRLVEPQVPGAGHRRPDLGHGRDRRRRHAERREGHSGLQDAAREEVTRPSPS